MHFLDSSWTDFVARDIFGVWSKLCYVIGPKVCEYGDVVFLFTGLVGMGGIVGCGAWDGR